MISVYDLRHFIIPNLFVWMFNIAAFLNIFIDRESMAGNMLAGLVFFSFFALLWLVSRGRWIGFGDAKLAYWHGFFNFILVIDGFQIF